jgi:hypothetical protein
MRSTLPLLNQWRRGERYGEKGCAGALRRKRRHCDGGHRFQRYLARIVIRQTDPENSDKRMVEAIHSMRLSSGDIPGYACALEQVALEEVRCQ